MVLITKAPIAMDLLNGVACLIKPSDISLNRISNVIRVKLSNDLNDMEVRPPKDYVYINETSSNKYTLTVKPSFADLPQVVGPRYMPLDIKLRFANFLGSHATGILLLGINDKGSNLAKRIQDAQWLRTYHVSGKLGVVSENCYKEGKIIGKSKYEFIKKYHMDKVLATLEVSFRKKMFEVCGISPDSQTAYELASKGPIRPSNKKLPVLYTMKCIHFNPPDFTLEIESINEKQELFWEIIHEIGLSLRSYATCQGVKCVRYGPFSLNDGLIRNLWNLQNIMTKIMLVNKKIEIHKRNPPMLYPPPNLIETSEHLLLESNNKLLEKS